MHVIIDEAIARRSRLMETPFLRSTVALPSARAPVSSEHEPHNECESLRSAIRRGTLAEGERHARSRRSTPNLYTTMTCFNAPGKYAADLVWAHTQLIPGSVRALTARK
jgi:hypothetical protein